MLNINLKEKGSKLSFDIESEFMRINIPDTKLNRLLINEIDQGEYIDSTFFIDRFGAKLYIDQLSTGCKAALLVANTNLNVDLQECGNNAISAIVRHCNNGTITLIDRGLTIMFDGKPDEVRVDVAIDGYHVKDIGTLNDYLKYMVDLDEPEYNAEKIK